MRSNKNAPYTPTTTPLPRTSTARFRPVAALFGFLLLGLFAVSGCEDDAVGRPCDLALPEGTEVNSFVLNSEALECPTRLCIRPNPEVDDVDTSPLCTAECSSDADCGDAAQRDATNEADKRCRGRFICALPPTASQELCCQKVCMCSDFFENNGNDAPRSSEACDTRTASCQLAQ